MQDKFQKPNWFKPLEYIIAKSAYYKIDFISLNLKKVKFYFLYNALKKYFKELILQFKKEQIIEDGKIPKIFWVCWLQGIENAPDIVKICINSLKAQHPDFKVNTIDLNNLSYYLTLDNIVLEKYKKGIISHAFFSDIIRVNLLSKYGGIWSDATILYLSALPNDTINCNFISLHTRKLLPAYFIVNGKWTAYFLGATPNYKLFKFISEGFNLYVKENDSLFDYFFIDYILRLSYESFNDLKKDFDSLPFMGENRYDLLPIINEKTEIAEDMIQKYPFKIYKLSHRVKYLDYDESDNITYYNKLKNIYLNES